MKVIWVTNILFEHHLDLMGFFDKSVNGGSWLYAAYDSLKDRSDIELYIVTTANIPTKISGKYGNSHFYILPGGGRPDYDIDSSLNINEWECLYREISPDIMVVWGTESRHAYLAMKTMKEIPKLIYVQGIINTIVNHYYDGTPVKYRYNSLRDIANIFYKNSQLNVYKEQLSLERDMFKMAYGVIIENDWCESICKNFNDSLTIYKNKLPIRDCFFNARWSISKKENYSIFTNAGGYPIKGHHVLFKALAIVKKRYPKVKCYIPGDSIIDLDCLKRRTGYVKYLKELIKDGDLEENIIYTGPLSSEDMAKRLAISSLFVMPSLVENHSSSLIEAMVVGVPCISSFVGGVPNVVNHNINGLLYNSLDYEALAGYIMKVLDDETLMSFLSSHAVAIKNERMIDFGEEMLLIYKSLMSQIHAK